MSSSEGSKMEASTLVDQTVPSTYGLRTGSRTQSGHQILPELTRPAAANSKEFTCLSSFREGIYIGMACQRVPEGAGLYRTPAGLLYVGEFHTGQFCGYGEMKKSNRVYKGQFLRGEMSGIGSIKTKKSIAVAQFVHDKKHGVAQISNNDKSQNMNGYYREGETRGFCIVTDPHKQVILSGMFEKTVLNGIGKEETAESVFIGNYRNNKKWGIGKITFLTSELTYTGSWKEDLKEGFGHLYDPEQHEDYEGSFSKDMKHGVGKLKCRSHKMSYIGRFEKNYYEGSGKLDFPGSFYLGNFHKSQRSGLGYERTQEHEIFFGYWLNDKRDGLGLDKNSDREYLGEWSKDLPHGRGLITMEGCTKAAIFDHGKLSSLLPDDMINELEQQFSSLNFEEFIHPMSKLIEDLHYQIEASVQELNGQIDHIEKRFESINSKLLIDIQKLQDQNKQVQDGCNRMAHLLESSFKTNGLDLKQLATIPYQELVAKIKPLDSAEERKDLRAARSREFTESSTSRKPRVAQNLQVQNPILNNSIRFDSPDHRDDSARVTPSLTMNGRDSPGRFEEFREIPEAPPKQAAEFKKKYQPEKRISMSEVAPYSHFQAKSKTPEHKGGSLAHSRLSAIPSRKGTGSKSKLKLPEAIEKSRVTHKKDENNSDEEVGFISNKTRISAKLDKKKHLNSGNAHKKLTKFEEEDRARKIEAERKELHARRKAANMHGNQEQDQADLDSLKSPVGKLPEVEAQGTLNSQSVPEAHFFGINQQDLQQNRNITLEQNQLPKAKIQASLLVSQFSLASPEPSSPEMPTRHIGQAPHPQTEPETPNSPEFGSVKFVPIRDSAKLASNPSELNPRQEESQVYNSPSAAQVPQPFKIDSVPEEDPNADASFEELMRHRNNQNGRRTNLDKLAMSPEIEKLQEKPPVDTKKLLQNMAKSAGTKGKQQLKKEQEEIAKRQKEEALRAKQEAQRLRDAKNLLGFKKSVVKLKQEAVQRNTLLNFGVTLVNRIMEQFNEDGEEFEKPLDSDTFTDIDPSEPEVAAFENEADFLSDPAEFGLVVKGYPTFKKIDADEKGNVVCLGGFKSLIFMKLNPKTKEYKTVKHYPSKFWVDIRIPSDRADVHKKELVCARSRQMGSCDLWPRTKRSQ